MKPHRIAIAWRGDREARAAATPANNRYHRIFAELHALGIEAEPAVYAEDIEDEVRAQLTNVDGVLVWVNPLETAAPEKSWTRCYAMWRRQDRGSALTPT